MWLSSVKISLRYGIIEWLEIWHWLEIWLGIWDGTSQLMALALALRLALRLHLRLALELALIGIEICWHWLEIWHYWWILIIKLLALLDDLRFGMAFEMVYGIEIGILDWQWLVLSFVGIEIGIGIVDSAVRFAWDIALLEDFLLLSCSCDLTGVSSSFTTWLLVMKAVPHASLMFPSSTRLI